MCDKCQGAFRNDIDCWEHIELQDTVTDQIIPLCQH